MIFISCFTSSRRICFMSSLSTFYFFFYLFNIFYCFPKFLFVFSLTYSFHHPPVADNAKFCSGWIFYYFYFITSIKLTEREIHALKAWFPLPGSPSLADKLNATSKMLSINVKREKRTEQLKKSETFNKSLKLFRSMLNHLIFKKAAIIKYSSGNFSNAWLWWNFKKA